MSVAMPYLILCGVLSGAVIGVLLTPFTKNNNTNTSVVFASTSVGLVTGILAGLAVKDIVRGTIQD